MSSSKIVKKLDDLVTLRGGIAHGEKLPGPVRKGVVTDYYAFTKRLAVVLSNKAQGFLHKQTGKESWKLLQHMGKE